MTYIALIRGINVGGRNMVAMSDLRKTIERLGFSDVKTLLQSGNVVFSGSARATSKVETLLEAEIAKRLKVTVDVHVRTPAEWKALIAVNPLRDEARRDPGHMLVALFKRPVSADRVEALHAAMPVREIIRADGRQVYIFFPDGIGNSPLAGMTEKHFGAKGTARNWNTVLKLEALSLPSR